MSGEEITSLPEGPEAELVVKVVRILCRADMGFSRSAYPKGSLGERAEELIAIIREVVNHDI